MVVLPVVVMAAGEGRRLRPLTERWPKPLLPIDGRPVLGTLLRELASGRFGPVTIVVGHLAAQVEALVGDGSPFGVEARFVLQPRADGSADAIRRALAGDTTSPPLLVLAADTVFTAGDVRRFAEAWTSSGADGAIAVRRDPAPGPGRAAVRIENGRVTRIVDDDPTNPLAAAPLWGLGPGIARYLDRVPGPPYEAAEAYQRAIADGLTVTAVEIGPTRDLTYPEDLIERNFPYLAR